MRTISSGTWLCVTARNFGLKQNLHTAPSSCFSLQGEIHNLDIIHGIDRKLVYCDGCRQLFKHHMWNNVSSSTLDTSDLKLVNES